MPDLLFNIFYCRYKDTFFLPPSKSEHQHALLERYFATHHIEAVRLSDHHYCYYKKRSWQPFTQEIHIRCDNNFWEVSSNQLYPTLYDFETNYKNVRQLAYFLDTEEWTAPVPPPPEIQVEIFPFPLPRQYYCLPVPIVSIRENTPPNTEAYMPPAEEKTSAFRPALDFDRHLPPYYMPLILSGLLIIIFLLMLLTSYTGTINHKVLKLWGANQDMHTLKGGYLRLVSNIFLHGSVSHLISNTIVLLLIGGIIEKWLGKKGFWMAFICTGVVGSATSLYFWDAVQAIGASGAIAGFYGLIWIGLICKVFPRPVIKPLFIINALMTLMLLYITYKQSLHIDHYAHIGGLAGGLLFGWLYLKVPQYKPSLQQYRSVIIISITFLIAVTVIAIKPKDFERFMSYMKRIDLYYQNGTYALNIPSRFSKERKLEAIENSIYYMDLLEKTLDTLRTVNVPTGYKQKVDSFFKVVPLEVEQLYLMQEGLMNDSMPEEALRELRQKIRRVKRGR